MCVCRCICTHEKYVYLYGQEVGAAQVVLYNILYYLFFLLFILECIYIYVYIYIYYANITVQQKQSNTFMGYN